MRRLSLGLILALGFAGTLGLATFPQSVAAYETTSTHPGMTGLAVLKSGLHRFLRAHGLKHGLFTTLTLQPDLMSKAEFEALRAALQRVPAASGARPDAVTKKGKAPKRQKASRITSRRPLPAQRPLQEWSLGWLMAGSMLQGMPTASDLKHFFDPVKQRGLSQGRTWRWGGASILDGRDSLPTKLKGPSAIRWLRDAKNPHSVAQWQRHITQAATAADPRRRDHHMAMALMALGGLLHVLQDMGSPTHTRNDYAQGHLQRLGGSSLDRGSAYERYVAQRYGRAGLPPYFGKGVAFAKIEDFFTSPDSTGLADISRRDHFSPGTLPEPQLAEIGVDANKMLAGLQTRLSCAQPSLTTIDLPCARQKTCYAAGPHGPRYAYRIIDAKLQFFLDYRCLAATARHLVPLSIGYSTGLIDHLLGLQPTPTQSALGLGNSASQPASAPASAPVAVPTSAPVAAPARTSAKSPSK
ncbi:MAG: hypothetical protein JRH20_07805 [Deltaproteobacteria bacterium]|nr:hypothetical protein [Deltaproteobacteria bacterium]